MPFLIVTILVSIAVALFALQNAVTVSLNFVFWSFTTSLVLVILGAFICGLLVAMCFMLTMKAKHYLADKKMKEEMSRLQMENARLNERINMLQHAQKLQQEAQQGAPAENTALQPVQGAEAK